MTREEDFIGQLEGYLDEYEGMTPLPEGIRDAVRAELPKTRQIGWLGEPMRRFPIMNKAVRVALVAAAAVVVAVFSFQFLTGPNVGGPGPSPSPSGAPTATPLPSPTVAAAIPPAGELAIGRHSMTLAGVPLSIELTTAGWSSNGEFGIDKGYDERTPDAASFILWPDSAPDNVFADPCTRTPLSPPAGPSAAELAAAVSTVPGINLVSGPSEVTVGGYPAQHVVLTVPKDIGCDPNDFYLWEDLDNPGDARYATELDWTVYVWIIDVNGTIVWIDGETYVTSSPEAAQEVQQIVDSIQFE